MKLLPVNSSDKDIQMLVVEWSEFMARGEFANALKLCPPDIPEWTATELKDTVAGYGAPAFASEGRRITS